MASLLIIGLVFPVSGFQKYSSGLWVLSHSASKTVMTDIYWVLKRYLLWFYYQLPCQKLMTVKEEPKSMHIIKSLSLKGRQTLTIKTATRDSWLRNIFGCECYSSKGKKETEACSSHSQKTRKYTKSFRTERLFL